VIGYVGMTGLATGPHLHYEYLMNGVHRNPQTVGLPGAEPLRADALQKFHAQATPLLASLSPQSGDTTTAAAANAPAVPAATVPAAPFPAPAVAAGDLRSNLSVY